MAKKKPVMASTIKNKEQYEELVRQGVPIRFHEPYPVSPTGGRKSSRPPKRQRAR